jgi:hypothetical protein
MGHARGWRLVISFFLIIVSIVSLSYVLGAFVEPLRGNFDLAVFCKGALLLWYYWVPSTLLLLLSLSYFLVLFKRKKHAPEVEKFTEVERAYDTFFDLERGGA